MSLLDFAIERFNIAEYVRGHGADIAQAGEYTLVCPSCLKQKLIVNTAKKAWHCWICQKYETVYTPSGPRLRPVSGAGGLIDLVQVLENCTRKQAVDRVMSAAFTLAHELATLPEVELRAGLLQQYAPAPSIAPPAFWKPITNLLPYCYERRIAMEDVRAFGLYYCDEGRYANRLIFPVYEEGRFVYFQARAMWKPRPGEPYVKAINPAREYAGTTSDQVLMNLDRARLHPRVAIVEGPMDCVRAGPDSVCTFGKAISATQVAKLVRAGVRAVDLMWDGPTEREPMGARIEMERTAPLLSSMFDLRIIYLPWGDPADHTREQLNWHRARADSTRKARLASV